MSDNPQPLDVPLLPLPHHAVVKLSGRDALAFAQAQFMNDVAALGDGQWQWSGWLNPKGRVQALFILLRVDEQTAWLVTTGEASRLVDEVKRFVFRSKVAIEVLDTVRVRGRLSAPGAAHGAVSAEHEGVVELDLSGDAGPRTLLLARGVADPVPDAAATDAWHALDLVHGWPALPGVALDAWTPQQLSLERLHAFSVKKGCYPGQEIVARTHFLGRAKRGLVLLEGASPLAAGAEVRGDGAALGTVVCASGRLALAVLGLEREPSPMEVDGIPVHERPLSGGLAR